MTAVRRLGEVELIRRFSRGLHRDASVLAGIGDDTAVVRGRGHTTWLLACDMTVEGTHFVRAHVPAPWVGWKALACNVSDIAAMGGQPRWAVVSLGLPPSTPVRWVRGLYRGLERCARAFSMSLVGGDTTRAPQIIVDVAIVGEAPRTGAVLRSGARAGDALFVTGRLGGSYVSGRHARFTPRVREAQALLRRVNVHAMMDLSDGLATDAWHMARASKATLRFEASRLPVARAAKTVHHALTDGEDFELLFAVRGSDAARVPQRLGRCPVTRIGTVVRRGAGVQLVDGQGRAQPLTVKGFQHF